MFFNASDREPLLANRIAEVPAGPISARGVYFIIVVLAVAAMAPELVLGLTVSDSFRFNLIWPEQFAGLFRRGTLYPHWLPLSWDGLGSPDFYFYPPLFFWVAALADTLTGGILTSERFAPIASLFFLAASGGAMGSWLGLYVDRRRALLGGVAYMLAPYHLYDIYVRGALAEAAAYASVPLVMLALAQVETKPRRYVPLGSLAYAALLLSHLPSALLVSLFLIPPYVALIAHRSARPFRFLAAALAIGLIGIALAAFYLLPAMTLLGYVSPRALSGAFYRPEAWFFWNYHPTGMGGRMLFIIPVSIAAFFLALGALLSRRSGSTLFWGALTISLVLVVAGAVPWLWDLPGLMLVQFPFRGLLLVEFATVTMIAIAWPSLRSPLMLAGVALLSVSYTILALLIAFTVERTWHGQQRTAAEIRTRYWSAAEYLPAGTKIQMGQGPDDVRISLPKIPMASATDARAKVSASRLASGGMAVSVDTPAATPIILRQFYFPHWRLESADGHALPIEPEPRQRVVTFRAPAGRSTFRLEPGTAPYEILGRTISLMALFAVALLAVMRSVGKSPVRWWARQGLNL